MLSFCLVVSIMYNFIMFGLASPFIDWSDKFEENRKKNKGRKMEDLNDDEKFESYFGCFAGLILLVFLSIELIASILMIRIDWRVAVASIVVPLLVSATRKIIKVRWYKVNTFRLNQLFSIACYGYIFYLLR